MGTKTKISDLPEFVLADHLKDEEDIVFWGIIAKM